ncbi:MAG TPA: tetratricopeptide repeat protein [Candidatus Dormibacteraeota bacterium]|nr:tetratricopeptide repeat protein [Candidatus Dormibacteraeota bacterium]
MRHPARRLRWVAPLLLLAATACSTAPSSPWGSTEPRDPGGLRAAGQLIAHADDLARRGQTRAALAAYERVLREHPGDPAGASALFGLGRLQADPAGGLRNYRAAQRTFSRLLADYPESRWEAEARTWQAVLGDLLAREAEAARLKEEAVRLRTQIEQLRRTDLDLERRR